MKFKTYTEFLNESIENSIDWVIQLIDTCETYRLEKKQISQYGTITIDYMIQPKFAISLIKNNKIKHVNVDRFVNSELLHKYRDPYLLKNLEYEQK